MLHPHVNDDTQWLKLEPGSGIPRKHLKGHATWHGSAGMPLRNHLQAAMNVGMVSFHAIYHDPSPKKNLPD